MSGSLAIRVGLLAAAIGVAHVAHARLPVASPAEQGEPFVPRPEVARATSLGFAAVLADYYWLRAVQIVGGEPNPEHHGHLLGRFIDVVTTLDPWVSHPYRFAAVWMVEDEEAVRAANRLLERAIEYHPDDWRMHFYLGFNHFYYLGDNETAADALEPAVRLRGAPTYLSRLVARLRADREGLDTAEAFLRELLKSAPDPYAAAEYEKALDEIETERRARFLDRARERYRERNGRDIASVEDLVRGPSPVLERLPPEPNDWEWVLHEETGKIVSSFYMYRYEPHVAARANHGKEGEGS